MLKKNFAKTRGDSLVVSDRAESILPDLGLIDYFDPENGRVMTVDTSSGFFRKLVYDQVKKDQEFREASLGKLA